MKRTICILLLSLIVGLLTVSGADSPRFRTVVIDAGHGGKDPGAVSKDKKHYEKTFTLDIAKRLAARIQESCPDVKVVLTRTTDVFVELGDRAKIANKAEADLFISIHINSAKNTSANGCSVHVMGQSSRKNTDLYEYNMNVVQRENSVILLEDDYSTKYEGFDPSDPESYIFMQLMQNAYLEQSLNFASIIMDELAGSPVSKGRGVWQNPFYVLWKTSMPAVLVELGFISNQGDLAALCGKGNTQKFADCLFAAFLKYKEAYNESLGSASAELPAAVPAPSQEETSAPAGQDVSPVPSEERPEVLYGIQIFAGSRSDINPRSSQFLGYEPLVVGGGKLYKYVIAVDPDPAVVRSRLAEVRKKYKDSYMVKISGDTLSPYSR